MLLGCVHLRALTYSLLGAFEYYIENNANEAECLCAFSQNEYYYYYTQEKVLGLFIAFSILTCSKNDFYCGDLDLLYFWLLT